jgi:hypothetical protein
MVTNRRLFLKLLGLMACAILILPACYGGGGKIDLSDDAGPGDNDGNNYGTILCTVSADCPAKQLCIDGLCYRGNDCFSEDDCGEGWSCNFVTNICVPDDNNCQSDADCQPPKPACQVETGNCVQCLIDSHCNTKRVGIGHCLTASNTCVDCIQDEHCGVDQFCSEQYQCLDEAECAGDADCISNERPHCNQSIGQCQECVEAGHCPSGMVCSPETHACESCYEDSHCTADKPKCDLSLGECVGCLADEDCPDGEHCNPYGRACTDVWCSSNNDCQEPNLEFCDTGTQNCVQCLTGAHCGYGEAWCRGFFCQVGCATSEECVEKFGPDQVCDPESGHCFRAECVTDADCTEDPGKPHCKTQEAPSSPPQYTCQECADNSHCPDFHKCTLNDFTCAIMPCYEYTDPDATCREIDPCYSCNFGNGQCEPSYECTYPDGTECCQGYSCNTVGHCDRNLTCSSNDDCPPDAECNLVTLQCEIPTCCDPPCSADEYCTTDCECLSGCHELGESCYWDPANAQGNCCEGLKCSLFWPLCTTI